MKEFKITEKTKITITKGGLLSCGEKLKFNQSKFGIFDKETLSINGLCLIGISKIKTIEVDDKYIEFLIYHNGVNDSENPFRYTTEKKNVW